MEIALGIYHKRESGRLREIAKLNTLNEIKVLKITEMKMQLRNTSETPLLNRLDNQDEVMLAAKLAILKCKEDFKTRPT